MRKFKDNQSKDSTEIVEVVDEKDVTVVDLDEKSKAKKEKTKTSVFVRTVQLGFIAIIVVAVAIGLVKTLGFIENRMDDVKGIFDKLSGKIEVCYSADDFKYGKADEVSDQFHQMGFKNIQIRPSKKSKIGLFVNDNTIDSIQIKGNKDFAAGSKFFFNDLVVINTYSLSNNYKTNRIIAIVCIVGLAFSLSAVIVLLIRKQKIKGIFALIVAIIFASGLYFASTNEKFAIGKVYHNTKIVVQSEKNLIWSKYPIEIMLDGKLIEQKIVDGDSIDFTQELVEGKHTIKFINSDDNSISASYTITVDENATYTFKIAKEKDKLKIVNNRPSIQHGIVNVEEDISEEPTDNITQETADPTIESDTLTSQLQ